MHIHNKCKIKRKSFFRILENVLKGKMSLIRQDKIGKKASGASKSLVERVGRVGCARLSLKLRRVHEVCEFGGSIKITHIVGESVQKKKDVAVAGHAMTNPRSFTKKTLAPNKFAGAFARVQITLIFPAQIRSSHHVDYTGRTVTPVHQLVVALSETSSRTIDLVYGTREVAGYCLHIQKIIYACSHGAVYIRVAVEERWQLRKMQRKMIKYCIDN